MSKPPAAKLDSLPTEQDKELETGEGVLSKFRRTANTVKDQGLSYFSAPAQQQGSGQTAASIPGTPNGADGSQTITQGGSGKPTAFERFMNLGKTRKEWNVAFPPPHWSGADETAAHETVETEQPGKQNLQCCRPCKEPQR